MIPFAEVRLAHDESVWVTGDVHLDPEDEARVEFFLDFFASARERTDRLCILGDLFDYWIGVEHARRSAYAPVLRALEGAAYAGFPVDFVAGNRDFLGPRELEGIGLRVHGDGLVYHRETGGGGQIGETGRRTIVTHGDLLVEGDASYKRYRRVVRSAPIRGLYRAVPVSVRLFAAGTIRRISRRKLGRIEPYAFAIDLRRAGRMLHDAHAGDLLMGHLHREERHEIDEGVVAMLPGWAPGRAPYFAVESSAELRYLS